MFCQFEIENTAGAYNYEKLKFGYYKENFFHLSKRRYILKVNANAIVYNVTFNHQKQSPQRNAPFKNRRNLIEARYFA